MNFSDDFFLQELTLKAFILIKGTIPYIVTAANPSVANLHSVNVRGRNVM
jgi:hypothetical protein